VDIKGTEVVSFFVCPRQLWFSSHQINMEEHSELVKIGKIVDEESYLRKRKKIYIEPIQLDLIDSQNKIIGEIKKSRKIEKAHRFQLLYYLFLLKIKGLGNFTGELLYPISKKKIKIILTPWKEKELLKILKEIEKVKRLPLPPLLKRRPYCK